MDESSSNSYRNFHMVYRTTPRIYTLYLFCFAFVLFSSMSFSHTKQTFFMCQMYEINLEYVSIYHIYFITDTLVQIVVVVVVIAHTLLSIYFYLLVLHSVYSHTFILLWESLNGKINILLHVRTTTTRLHEREHFYLCYYAFLIHY